MAAIVEDAGKHEQRSGGDAVIQHLIDGAVGSSLSESKDAEDDEAEMAHGRVGDELLEIRLHHRDERAIDDSDDSERGDPSGLMAGFIREEPDVEAKQS